MPCIYCNSNNIRKKGSMYNRQLYKCVDCNGSFLGEEYPYFYHFNVRVRKKDGNNLTRENYCKKTYKVSYDFKKYIKNLNLEYQSKNQLKIPKDLEIYLKFPNEKYDDKEHYSEKWVENHYNDCMKNFDLNMKYFENLDYDDFSKTLKAFVNKNKFIEVTDLNDAVFGGIYIMVLDKYKQVYIGASSYIRKRIPAHWRKRKEFDKLIYGNIEDSVLSIDSFGALDTTRIFCKQEDKYYVFSREEKYVKKFDNKYLLNRVAGGINDEHKEELRNLKLMGSRIKRHLK